MWMGGVLRARVPADSVKIASPANPVGANYTQGHANRPHGYFTGLVIQAPMGWKLRWAHWSSLPATT